MTNTSTIPDDFRYAIETHVRRAIENNTHWVPVGAAQAAGLFGGPDTPDRYKYTDTRFTVADDWKMLDVGRAFMNAAGMEVDDDQLRAMVDEVSTPIIAASDAEVASDRRIALAAWRLDHPATDIVVSRYDGVVLATAPAGPDTNLDALPLDAGQLGVEPGTEVRLRLRDGTGAVITERHRSAT